ncbi:MAG: uroporphyrinogen-III C-methyltransferase [Bacteroidales bacterium]|nr:uroporphyrinogen-III C-methyltransferase [Bacteroidales bacterium]
MNFLPISINIENKKILMIGGGKVAYHKIILLQRFTSNITVIAKEVAENVRKTGATIIEKSYEKTDLSDFFLVFAATNNTLLNKQILNDGHEQKILVNVVDNPAFCDFVSPAIYRKNNMTVAVGSNGEDVYKSITWRNKIHDVFEYGFLVAWFRSLFKRKSMYPSSKKIVQTEFKKGTVYLVGFGPGNPDLMTVRAQKALQAAEIIFHDDLIDASVLSKYDAQKVYVGKRRDNHHRVQDEINLYLLQAAQQNKIVVRLKGGDPLIFGRGIEEKQFLVNKGILVDIIPGITSGLAAAALSGIPLTHRGVASSVAIGTAHAKNSFKVLDADTSIYYMGANNLKEIADQYLKKGYPETFPVGVVYNVSFPNQHTTITNLKEILNNKYTFQSPIISIFGYSINERISFLTPI